MARVLLIGSGNRDKLRELRGLLSGSAWDVKGLGDFETIEEPEETEGSFEGNALLKARYYGRRLGVACVADDSGIEVDALKGEPGVYSARYAGQDCSYDDNNRKMLSALADVEASGRGARFVSCAAFVDEDGTEHIEVGTVDGMIARECAGEHGFGYDPLFVPEGYENTFGELGPEVKAKISHRGRAFRAMSAYLDSYLV